ncbi:hypothetical protein [Yaniella halotolerans]|uniref:hypothetical protein n=1 Tax=Yaniella halotolerans TaxID=225453 RepID=UPI0003B56F5A|nr:hypothetical protein [Yaniella halotolerans]
MAFLALDSITNRYDLYVPDDPFSPSELSAMAYHGLLRPQFGPYYVDATTPDTAAQRAKAVRYAGEQLIDRDWTATMLTAAWIHLGGLAPEMFEASTATYQKTRSRTKIIPTAFRHIDYMQRSDIAEQDLLVIGGTIVTSLELTLEDLLRSGRTARHYKCAEELADLVDLDNLQQRFHHKRHLYGVEQARQRLEHLLTPSKDLADVR